MSINNLEVLVDVWVVVKDGLWVAQDQGMQELDEHELGLIQGEEGQCNAVHDGWEEHAEDQAVKERLLTHQVTYCMHIETAAIAQDDLL